MIRTRLRAAKLSMATSRCRRPRRLADEIGGATVQDHRHDDVHRAVEQHGELRRYETGGLQANNQNDERQDRADGPLQIVEDHVPEPAHGAWRISGTGLRQRRGQHAPEETAQAADDKTRDQYEEARDGSDAKVRLRRDDLPPLAHEVAEAEDECLGGGQRAPPHARIEDRVLIGKDAAEELVALDAAEPRQLLVRLHGNQFKLLAQAEKHGRAVVQLLVLLGDFRRLDGGVFRQRSQLRDLRGNIGLRQVEDLGRAVCIRFQLDEGVPVLRDRIRTNRVRVSGGQDAGQGGPRRFDAGINPRNIRLVESARRQCGCKHQQQGRQKS